MVTVGSAAVLGVKQRLRAAQGPNDTPAKPLTVPYARFKSRKHKGNRRDLWFTGKMLGNFQLRTVSDNQARASLTSRKERIKGLANFKREPWPVFSPANRKAVIEKARQIFLEAKKRLIIPKALS